MVVEEEEREERGGCVHVVSSSGQCKVPVRGTPAGWTCACTGTRTRTTCAHP